MTWVLIAAIAWPVVALVVAPVVARMVHLSNDSSPASWLDEVERLLASDGDPQGNYPRLP